MIVTLGYSQYDGKDIEISVNEDLRIEECLRIINNSRHTNVINLNKVQYCFSKEQKRAISIYGTFKQNNIHNGDLLKLM